MIDPGTPVEPADDGETRFLEQVLLAIDGQLGAEELAALQGQLALDVDKRRLYVELCLQSQALTEVLGLHREDAAPDDRDSLGPSDLRLVGLSDVTGFARDLERR